MSELPNNPPSPEQAPPVAAAAAPPEPVVLQAGSVCEKLNAQGFALTPVAPDASGKEVLCVDKSALLKVADVLKSLQFDLLTSVAGVDYKTHREVIYHLYSTETTQWLAMKVIAVDEKCPSVYSVWPAADWHERETFDLYGIEFEGHPNLKRILMPDDWLGHPLRKDYVLDDPRLVWNER